MLHRSLRPVGAGVTLCAALLAFGAPAAAVGREHTATRVSSTASTTFKGAFEFEGNAARAARKGCRGAGLFGEVKVGARVTISERSTAGEFETLGRGKLRKGKIVETTTGDEVCRMRFRVTTDAAPAADSVVYLEVKGFTFDISWPAAEVADGELGTWRCEFSDDSCALLVGDD